MQTIASNGRKKNDKTDKMHHLAKSHDLMHFLLHLDNLKVKSMTNDDKFIDAGGAKYDYTSRTSTVLSWMTRLTHILWLSLGVRVCVDNSRVSNHEQKKICFYLHFGLFFFTFHRRRRRRRKIECACVRLCESHRNLKRIVLKLGDNSSKMRKHQRYEPLRWLRIYDKNEIKHTERKARR